MISVFLGDLRAWSRNGSKLNILLMAAGAALLSFMTDLDPLFLISGLFLLGLCQGWLIAVQKGAPTKPIRLLGGKILALTAVMFFLNFLLAPVLVLTSLHWGSPWEYFPKVLFFSWMGSWGSACLVLFLGAFFRRVDGLWIVGLIALWLASTSALVPLHPLNPYLGILDLLKDEVLWSDAIGSLAFCLIASTLAWTALTWKTRRTG